MIALCFGDGLVTILCSLTSEFIVLADEPLVCDGRSVLNFEARFIIKESIVRITPTKNLKIRSKEVGLLDYQTYHGPRFVFGAWTASSAVLTLLSLGGAFIAANLALKKAVVLTVGVSTKISGVFLLLVKPVAASGPC